MPISEKTRSAYHHGDLRNAMITVARRALNEGNYEALSLRECTVSKFRIQADIARGNCCKRF
jgi:hypothetical protein